MEFLIAAYACGWIAVAAYVGRLRFQNARLLERLRELEALAASANSRPRAAA